MALTLPLRAGHTAGAGWQSAVDSTPPRDRDRGQDRGPGAQAGAGGDTDADARAPAGLSTAFEELFRAEYGTVVAIACRVLGDRTEAEDVAQEVFVSFHRQDRHRPDASYAGPWLHAAAAHTALNTLRGHRRRTQREESDAYANERLMPAAEMLDPQQLAIVHERQHELRVALARLPARSATVLVLRYSGLSYAEVAAALKVSAGGVGTLLRRAEAALRKEIERATPATAPLAPC